MIEFRKITIFGEDSAKFPWHGFCILVKKILTHLLIRQTETIQGFTISVPVLTLPVFRQLLLRNGKISSKSLFWNERTRRTDSRWQQESYFTSTLISFSITLFQIGVIFWLNYYRRVTKSSVTCQIETIFCRYSIAFKGMYCRSTISYDSLLLEEHVPKAKRS